MKVVVVLSDDWCSRFSKPIAVKKVRAFYKKWKNTYNVIYFERKYNFF